MGFLKTIGNAVGGFLNSASGGSAIGAGINLIGGILGNKSGQSQNDKNNAFQAAEAEKQRQWYEEQTASQNQWNLDQYYREQADKLAQWNREQAAILAQWNRDNEYNSAAAQAKRFKEAGLNPALAMTGGASAGVAGNAPTASGETASGSPAASPGGVGLPNTNPYRPDMSMFSNAAFMLGDMAQNIANVDFTKAQTSGNQIENQWNLDTYGDRWDTIRLGNKYTKQQTIGQKFQNRFDKITMESRIKNQELQNDYIAAQTAFVNLGSDEKRILNKYLPAQQQADLMLKAQQQVKLFYEWSRIKELTPHEVNQAKANLVKTFAEANLIGLQADGQKISNEVAQATAGHIIDQCFFDAATSEIEMMMASDEYEAVKPWLRTQKKYSGWHNAIRYIDNTLGSTVGHIFGGGVVVPFKFNRTNKMGRVGY